MIAYKMKWIILAAEAVFIGIGLYCSFRNRQVFHKRFFLKAAVESVGTEAASRIPAFRVLPQELRMRIRILHPDQSEKESCTEYIRQKAAQIYIILLIANTILLFMSFGIKEPHNIGYSLERPAYGRRDRVETLTAKGMAEETEVRITVPMQDPTAEQAEEVLRIAEEKLREEIEKIVPVRDDFYLPVQIGGVEVSYLRNSENGRSHVSEDGFIRVEEDTEAIRLSAILLYKTFSRVCTLSIPIKEADRPTFAQVVQEAVESAELTPSALELPATVTVDESEETVVWQTPEKQKDINRYVLLAWILPFAILPLGRIELKQKEKERLREITLRFPFLIEKLTVYLGAGLSLTEAWNRIPMGTRMSPSLDKDPLTEEVEVTRIQIRNGMPLQEALQEFGGRIPNADIRKLAGMLSRNLRRGDDYLLDRLTELNQNAWESYRKEVRIRSEETETKMLLPMILLLLVVLLLVMAPAMLTFRG